MRHLAPFLLGVSAVFILYGIPLVFGVIPRNRWLGIRTRPAMRRTDAQWYAINRRGGLAFLAIGLLLVPLAYAIGFIHL